MPMDLGMRGLGEIMVVSWARYVLSSLSAYFPSFLHSISLLPDLPFSHPPFLSFSAFRSLMPSTDTSTPARPLATTTTRCDKTADPHPKPTRRIPCTCAMSPYRHRRAHRTRTRRSRRMRPRGSRSGRRGDCVGERVAARGGIF